MNTLQVLLLSFFFVSILGNPPHLAAQNEENLSAEALFVLLAQKDSLIFKLGYNECDTTVMRALLSDDFEFYHDQAGITNSNETFIAGIPNLCQMSYKATRQLTPNTLQVFPLYNQGKLYGAIQTGKHEFYGEEPNKPIYLTSTAIFSHLWIVEDGDWKLKRVLSYDHQTP